MALIDPAQFKYIDVRPAKQLPMREAGPYRVVGINSEPGEIWEGEKDIETVIFENIPTKQIANRVMEMYLNKHVEETYFSGAGDC